MSDWSRLSAALADRYRMTERVETPVQRAHGRVKWTGICVNISSLMQGGELPLGHMAGMYARVDMDRGVHRAPANEVILRVWGARTLTSDMSLKYINVRRLFILFEESSDERTQWVVFEPTDDPTWARVRQTSRIS